VLTGASGHLKNAWTRWSFSGWKRASFSMNIQPDFEDFLRLLETHRVDYMIVGGYAVAFHGYPRFTKDLDIFFDPSPDNVERLRQVLIEFGFREENVRIESLRTLGNVIVIGVAPVRIDLVNRIDGVSFAEARPNVVRSRYGGVEATFIGREDLLQNKRSTPRAKDKADVEELS
jgi:hypothetical protein